MDRGIWSLHAETIRENLEHVRYELQKMQKAFGKYRRELRARRENLVRMARSFKKLGANRVSGFQSSWLA